MFGVICILFDGSPYFLCPVGSVLFMVNAFIVFYFLRWRHSRQMLVCGYPSGTHVHVFLDLLLCNDEYRIRRLRYSLLLDRLLNLRRRQEDTRRRIRLCQSRPAQEQQHCQQYAASHVQSPNGIPPGARCVPLSCEFSAGYSRFRCMLCSSLVHPLQKSTVH